VAWPGAVLPLPAARCACVHRSPPHHGQGYGWARGRRTSPSEQAGSGRGKWHAGSGLCVRRASRAPRPEGWSSPDGAAATQADGVELPDGGRIPGRTGSRPPSGCRIPGWRRGPRSSLAASRRSTHGQGTLGAKDLPPVFSVIFYVAIVVYRCCNNVLDMLQLFVFRM
jgi:hypothetical protein